MLRLKTILTVVVMMFASHAMAQFYFPIIIPSPSLIKKNNNKVMAWGNDGKSLPWKDNYVKSMIPWKDHQLSWDDFKGLSPATNENDGIKRLAYISLMSRPYVQKQKIDGVTYEYYQNEALMNELGSWVIDSCKTKEGLKLMQADFNLWELYSRRAIMEYSITPDASLEELFDFYKQRVDYRCNEIMRSTDYGSDADKLQAYCDSIDRELEKTQIDPVSMVSHMNETGSYYIFMGLSSGFPFSDYISSKQFGFNIGGGGFIKRHMIDLELNIEFGGECRKEFQTSDGKVKEGEDLTAGGINLHYGYKVFKRGIFEVSPYVGAGVRIFNGDKKDEHSDNNKRKQMSGLSLGIGCSLDFILNRHVYIKTQDETVRKRTSGISVRPYLSFTDYKDDLGRVPALNIAVDWNMNMFKLR